MALVWIKRRRVDVDLKEELEAFNWTRAKWIDEKLIACSPFRYDSSPSFFVNLENLPDKEIAGTWLDSGASHGDEFRSGNFVQLLAFLRQETEEETADYLMEKYDFKPYEGELKLKLDLKIKQPFKPLPRPEWEIDRSYLRGRSIAEEVCQEAEVLTPPNKDKVAFLWKSPAGEIEAIKYRSTTQKTFFYEKGGKRLNELLFGIDYVYKNKCESVAICEAEIDALSWRTVGSGGAVAVGGSNFSDKQASLLIRSGVKNIILSLDNDRVGRELERKIYNKLSRYFTFWRVVFPPDIKDMNEWIVRYGAKKPPAQRIQQRAFF